MHTNEYYMQRCLDLARMGQDKVAPNPMVGSVIVHRGRIVGEGYHRQYGEAHAEVNAIASVKDPSCLAESTLYVNLEPCSHYGKTPPCSQLIIARRIPRVVVGAVDVNPHVSGQGILQMEKTGIRVKVGVLEEMCWALNIRFYRYQEERRPYIILKWAETRDAYVDTERQNGAPAQPTWITGKEERRWVHKWRANEQAIMAGSGTICKDNPRLTVRNWYGKNPLRIVLDREGIVPTQAHILDDEAPTLIFGAVNKQEGSNQYLTVGERDPLPFIMETLYQRKIQSLFVEGGPKLIEKMIEKDLWDEARVFTGDKTFQGGIKAPVIAGLLHYTHHFAHSTLSVYRNPQRVYQKA